MRRRATFIHDADLGFDPGEVQVTPEKLFHAGLKAAREERLTYGFDELPEELQQVLAHSHELHIRWAPEHDYTPIVPFLSRLPPGLHLFYTPLEGHSDNLLCPLLQKSFSNLLKCHSPNSTFTQPPILSERFAATAALQFHSLLPSLNHLVAYLQRDICSRSNQICSHDASLLNLADSLDIDYDSISHTLTLTAFWSTPPSILYDPVSGSVTEDTWPLDIQRASEVHRVEVGILSLSPATDAHDFHLSGFLTVIGDDDKPKPTRFHFPSRHHSVPEQQSQQQYTASIREPQGLHPTLQVSFSSATALTPPESRPEDSHCALQMYFVLPSYVFVDEYAFGSGDPLFAESNNIRATHSISGETDLEAPDYVVKRWGSTLLIEPAVSAGTISSSLPGGGLDVMVPLHLRYLAPSAGGQSRVDVPWPIVYWACTAEEGTKFPVNPFDRINLGFEGLYGPRTMFYHLVPTPHSSSDSRLVNTLDVPVYNTDTVNAYRIELITLITVVCGFLWVVAKLWPATSTQMLRREQRSGGAGESKLSKKEQ